MKALFALFTAFLVVFFLGCQESSITDPGAVNDNAFSQQQIQDPANKDLLSYYPYVLEIPETVFDPTHPNFHGSKITGFIRYGIQHLPVFGIAQRPRYEVEARFYINLTINPNCPKQDKPMQVVGLASELVEFYDIDTNSPRVVTKEFNVCHCCCGCLKLVLKFNVFNKEVNLHSMQLVEVKGMPIGDPES
jgi:hypothetical protein